MLGFCPAWLKSGLSHLLPSLPSLQTLVGLSRCPALAHPSILAAHRAGMPQQVWGTDLILSRRLVVLAPWSPRLGLLRLLSDAQCLAPPPRAVRAMTTVHGAEAGCSGCARSWGWVCCEEYMPCSLGPAGHPARGVIGKHSLDHLSLPRPPWLKALHGQLQEQCWSADTTVSCPWAQAPRGPSPHGEGFCHLHTEEAHRWGCVEPGAAGRLPVYPRKLCQRGALTRPDTALQGPGTGLGSLNTEQCGPKGGPGPRTQSSMLMCSPPRPAGPGPPGWAASHPAQL